MATSRLKPLWIVGALCVAVVGVAVFRMSTALSPEQAAAITASVSRASTLDQALELGAAERKPVVAFTTAAWCPPCQSYKKNALSDLTVQQWLRENVVAVMLDADRSGQDVQRLGVRGLPTTVVINNGEIVGKQSGAIPGQTLIEWLGTFVENAAG